MDKTPKKAVAAKKPITAKKSKAGGRAAPVSFAERVLPDRAAHHAAAHAELERLAQHTVSPQGRARWLAAAEALKPDKVSYPSPWAPLISEAWDVARFLVQRWHPRNTPGFSATRPGMSQVTVRLPYETTTDLVELAQMAAEAQRRVLFYTKLGAGQDVRPEAVSYLGDLVRALTFLFDDGVEDEADDQLAALRAAHESPDTETRRLASAIEDYTALAQQHRAALAAIHFDTQRLDLAPDLVAALRINRPALLRAEDAKALTALRVQRDRLATLLYDKMRLVRAGAQFVFAKHPKVVREVTSAYQRDARAARRKASQATDDANPNDPT